MADKASIIKETQKYMAKGQLDRAISEWESFLQSSPDANSFNILGDLYLKNNARQTAIERFHRAAEIFRKEGFSLKALALYKKILNIAPSDAGSLYALGELSEERSIMAEAVKYYLQAAGLYMKDGRKAEAVRTYARLVRLNPGSLQLRKQAAGVYSEAGFVEEASNEYVEIAGLLEAEAENQEALGYLERAVEIKPSNREALAAAASLSEKMGNTEKAAEFLKTAVSRAGGNDESLLRLAGLCLAAGKTEEARKYAGELLRADPSGQNNNKKNLPARRVMAEAYLKEGNSNEAWRQYVPVIEELASGEQFDEALAIADAFMETEPVAARRVLIALLKRKNGTEEVLLNRLKELGELLRASGDARGAAECFKEAMELSPGDEQMAANLRELAWEDAGEERAVLPPGEAQTEEKPVLDVISLASGMVSSGLGAEAMELLESFKLKAPGSIPLHLKLKSLYLEANDREQAVTECIILAELYRRAGDEPGRNGVIEEAFALDPSDARLPERFGAREARDGRSRSFAPVPVPDDAGAHMGLEDKGANPAELAERLSEAAFYAGQGLFEEAEKIYTELSVNFPLDETIKDRLREVEALKGRQDSWPGPVQAEVPAGEGESFSFPGGSSSGAGGGLDPEVGKIFDEFKKGVEKQVDAGDAETRYNLGIAYKEMGLLDDAIRELRAILEDPAFGIRSASVLAACYMERGLLPQAADVLEAAIGKAGPAHEAHWGLKYDLAQVREKNAQAKEALQLYTEVCQWNKGFREAASRITALGGILPGDGGKAPARKGRISYI